MTIQQEIDNLQAHIDNYLTKIQNGAIKYEEILEYKKVLQKKEDLVSQTQNDQ